jgi:hypothetical protein
MPWHYFLPIYAFKCEGSRKLTLHEKEKNMKWMIAIALFAVAILIATGSAAAETPQQAYYQTILYSVPPVPVMEMCFVNGVNYPVGYSYRIWAAYGYGGWVVIGKITNTPNGTIAVRNHLVSFPAFCQ